jgi:hypothetical protein
MPIKPNNDIPMPEGFQPYAIIEEKYIKSVVTPNLEDGSLIQTPSRYVEILLSNSMGYEFLPTDVATGSLAYILTEGALLFFNGEYWEDVGGKGSGGGDIDDGDNGNISM